MKKHILQLAGTALISGVLSSSLTTIVFLQTSTESPNTTGQDELIGNGIAFTQPTDIVLLPDVDAICHIDSSKTCRVNTDDSSSFYALGRVHQGSVEILPIEISSSWGLSGESPAFEQFLTQKFKTKPNYSSREITIQSVDWGYGDPTHPPQNITTTVIEYTDVGFFSGKGDLHHAIVKYPSTGSDSYLDISFTDNDTDQARIVDDLLKSLVLFFPTS